MKKYIIILIFIAIFTNCPSWAATYFVSQSGSGSKDGKSYANRASVTYHNAGAGVFRNLDGDTVYLCGTITSQLNTPDGGTSGNEVTYSGDCSVAGGTDVDFEVGSAATAIVVDVAYTIWTWIQTSGVTGQGIEFDVLSSYGYVRNSHFTSTTAGAGGIWIDRANDITIGGSASYSNLFENVGSTGTEGEDIALSGDPSNHATNITISYNELKGTSGSAGVDGIMVDSADNDDIGKPGKEVIIEHNYIHDHYRENELDFKGGGYYIIRKNILAGSSTTYSANEMQVHFQSGCDHIYMYGNVLRGHDKGGILIWDHTATGQAVEHIYIWSNLIYNMDWMGINTDDDNQGINNVRLWNLTVVDNANDPAGKTDSGLKMNDALESSDALQVYNSIFAFNRAGLGVRPSQQLYIRGTTNFSFDYNLYHAHDADVNIWHDGSLKDFDKHWQTAVSQDANSTEASPRFTNRASDDYTTIANLTGTNSGATLRAWHADADKGLSEDSNINPQQCGNTPGGYAKCAKGIILVDRDSYNDGHWGKGAFVYGSKGSAGDRKTKLQVRNLRIKY